MTILIIFISFCKSAFADEFRVISFHYPPYTYQDGRDGLAITNIRKAFERAGHRVNVQYYPVARAFQKFLMDKDAFFAGHISQFKASDKLDYVTNLNVTHRVLVSSDYTNAVASPKRIAVLRDDQIGIDIAKQMNAQPVSVENNQQAFEMMLAGRLDFLNCLSFECETLITQSGKKLSVLAGSESSFELQLVYHRDSNSGKQALLASEKGFFRSP
ncbi:MAG: transporter substrate-binding domain-containing protein [Rhodoferax sp.]|nr:transporter substrate-binding domain-containing protein [Rhodoferax sp.]